MRGSYRYEANKKGKSEKFCTWLLRRRDSDRRVIYWGDTVMGLLSKLISIKINPLPIQVLANKHYMEIGIN